MTTADLGALDLEQIMTTTWELLTEAAAGAASPFHTPALATLGSGGPQVRTVVLRHADEDAAALVVHTDRRSPKFQQLMTSPQVAVLFYDRPGKLQLRMNGVATVHVEDELAEARWQASGHSSRQCYRLANGPGELLEGRPTGPAPVIDDSGRGNFAVVRIGLASLDWLYLRAAGHQRARFQFLDGAWRGAWVAP